jgi:hypothetical protein
MTRRLMFLILLLASNFCTSAYADTEADFVQITCIKEMGYLHVEHRTIEVGSTRRLGDPEEVIKRKFWNRYGLYSPQNLHYRCQIESNIYEVTARQAPQWGKGQCGAFPDISLRVTRNDKPIFDDVLLGNSCENKAVVKSIEIQEQTMSASSGVDYISLCISKDSLKLGLGCKFFADSLIEHKNFLFTQTAIDDIAGELANKPETEKYVWD